MECTLGKQPRTFSFFAQFERVSVNLFLRLDCAINAKSALNLRDICFFFNRILMRRLVNVLNRLITGNYSANILIKGQCL